MMIFMHKHFTRGDKKKCLAMNSIVNVKSKRRQGGSLDRSRLSYGGDVVHLPQHGNSQIYGGHNSILRGSVCHGGAYNMLNGRVNPGLPMSYGFSMQQTTQMSHSNYLSNGLNWTVPGLVHSRNEVTQRPSVTAAVAGSLPANHGYSAAGTVSKPSAGRSDSGRAAEEVNLAALIMNEDRTIDAWQALQLAKRHLNDTSTISDMMWRST